MLELLENLPGNVLLLGAQTDSLRMILAETADDFLLALGDRQIARPQGSYHRGAALVRYNSRIVDSALGTRGQYRLILIVKGSRPRGVSLRQDQLAVDIRELLLGNQRSLSRRQTIGGPEALGLEGCCL